jgi:hypothetical protein
VENVRLAWVLFTVNAGNDEIARTYAVPTLKRTNPTVILQTLTTLVTGLVFVHIEILYARMIAMLIPLHGLNDDGLLPVLWHRAVVKNCS